MTTSTAVGIREVSELTGLSPDTLRWYEREGLLPLVQRTPDGRRRYGPAAIRFIRLVQALRRTGMPVAEVRDFVRMGPGTPDNSVRRLDILTRQEEELRRRIDGLQGDLRVIQDKIDDYRTLIAAGRDCEDDG
ncbi:MerR family transcriptional regulator [Actinoplanes couchii]|uniref:Transcriptional regulator, MerR family protein n=1 Tax=Actinoplanes couchii TaxID=403638 RepID=A0ABQ3XKL5_9ACTN|nr:MerR family transcriptional regulator [Actinoplanes couchii]MDR6319569.1 DNA-binding transcriptional MerR regulator [Actinoplanes couchii]GID59041.1 putative transcriptional regulator, MerR family protein [Actinoplanes couchii]